MTPSRHIGVERWFIGAGLFLLPLAYSWDTYDGYVLPKLLIARVLVIGLLILFFARLIVNRILAIRRTPLDIPLLVFVVSASVSTLFAYNRNVAIFGTYSRYDGLLTILTYALLFWLSVQTLASPADARTLLRILLASGYLVAAVAILQSVGDSTAQGVTVRAHGSLGQANLLGAFLAMLCPLGFLELVEANSWSKRVIALNVLAVIGVALLLSGSRSAWLGTAVAGVVIFTTGSRHPTFRLNVMIVSGLVFVGLLIAALSLSGLQLERRATSLFDPGAWGPRAAIWRDTVNLIASRPVLGYGPDNFGLVYPHFQTTDFGRQQVDKAHAEMLQLAATQGLVGLAANALVLVAFVRAFWRGRHEEGAAAIFAAWLAYQVTLQLNFSAIATSLPFWVFAAAAMQSWGAIRTVPLGPFGPRRLTTAAAVLAITALAPLAVVGAVVPYLADSRLLVSVKADIEGRGNAAVAAAAEARDLAPEESVYAVEVGNIAFERGAWANAATAYGDAASLGTYNPLVYTNLAIADRNLGRMVEARAAAYQAVELDRFDPASRALLAQFDVSSP